MSDEEKKTETNDERALRIAIGNAYTAAGKLVDEDKRAGSLKDLSPNERDSFFADVRVRANAAIRAAFPAMRAFTKHEHAGGFQLGFIDRENGSAVVTSKDFKIAVSKATDQAKA